MILNVIFDFFIRFLLFLTAPRLQNSWQRWREELDYPRGSGHLGSRIRDDECRDRCEVRPRKDKRGIDLISDVLPFGRLWYGEPNAISNAIGYAEHRSRSHDAVIRVYDAAGNMIETHEHAGDFKEW
jgi:hypothetical protein